MSTPNVWMVVVTAFSLLAGAYATVRASRTDRARANNESKSQAFRELESVIDHLRDERDDLRAQRDLRDTRDNEIRRRDDFRKGPPNV